MGQEYPLELREEAAGLYIEGGMTYDQVAAETGVSKTQVVRWASDGAWRARRAEYRAALSGIQRDTVHLRRALVERAMETLDPQAVYAVARMEQVAGMGRRAAAAQPAPAPEILRQIETPADAVAAVRQAIEARVNAMLARPDRIELKELKDMKQALELWEGVQAKYRPEEPEADKALGAETIAAIREKLNL